MWRGFEIVKADVDSSVSSPPSSTSVNFSIPPNGWCHLFPFLVKEHVYEHVTNRRLVTCS